MYTALLHSHNMFRWLVLIALILAIGFALGGWMKKGKWERRDKITGLWLVLFMDLQFILGIVLYTFMSPITKAAFNNFGAAMKNTELRFYAVEHILIMVFALVLIHLGRAKSKKSLIDWKKHRIAAIYYTLGLLLILAAIPWNRALV